VFPNILIPELYLFGLDHNLKQFEIQRITSLLTNISTPHHKGIAQLCLGRYYEEISEDLDSSWHYLNLAHHSFIQTEVISNFYIKCIEKLTLHSTYKRNYLLAIRFANYLFDYKKHYPAIDSVTKAIIFSNRAFVLYREGDYDGTFADIKEGLSYIDKNKHPEVFQNLMKSNLAVSTLKNDEKLWNQSKDEVEKSILNSRDYIALNRWIGQWYYYKGNLNLAEKFTLEGLKNELGNHVKNPARFSTLCYTLSSIYIQKGEYNKSIKYTCLAENIDISSSPMEIVNHFKTNYAFSFYPALELSKLHFLIYEKHQNQEDLQNAKLFIDLVDELLYKQMNTSLEENLLNFFEEAGADFFDTGLMIYEQLYHKSRKKEFINKFLEYSEKRKNSILYRDFYTTKVNSILPKEIIEKERTLRYEIKKERTNGFRFNPRFDRLIDDYTVLENEHIKKNKTFFEQGLNFNYPDFNTIVNNTLNSNESFLIVDETSNFWFYTFIEKGHVNIRKKLITTTKIDSILTMTKRLAQRSDSMSFIEKNYTKSLLPENLIVNASHINLILDGIYSYVPLNKFFKNQGKSTNEIPSIKWYAPSSDTKNEVIYKDKEVAVFSFSDLNTIKNKDRTLLPELPGAYKEALALQKKYPQSKLFLGNKATKQNFIKMYQNPRIKYIHLALHGNANSTAKDDIKLYFRTETNGLDSLYGYELLQYKSNCAKVVLAACNSDVGKYIRGEGTYSLPRYFMLNGAGEVVAFKELVLD
jgi:hypothetical protein